MNQRRTIPIVDVICYAAGVATNPALVDFFFDIEPSDQSCSYGIGFFEIETKDQEPSYTIGVHKQEPHNKIYMHPSYMNLEQRRAQSIFYYHIIEYLRDNDFQKNSQIEIFATQKHHQNFTSIQKNILQFSIDPEILTTDKIYTPLHEKEKLSFGYLDQNLADITEFCPEIKKYKLLSALAKESDGVVAPTQFIALKGESFDINSYILYSKHTNNTPEPLTSAWNIYMVGENAVDLVSTKKTLVDTIETLQILEEAFIDPQLKKDAELLGLYTKYSFLHYQNYFYKAKTLDITNGRNQSFGLRFN